MKNHLELFQALIDKKEIVNEYNDKLKFNEHNMVVATENFGGISYPMFEFDPYQWHINK